MVNEYVKKEKERIDSDYRNIEELNAYQEREKRIFDLQNALIEELASLRKNKQLSQRELCEIINFKQPALAKLR